MTDLRHKSRGQAISEFALVFPILVLMFFGIFEFGRFVLAYESLNNAIREGARYAVVHGANSLCPSGPMPGGGTSLSVCADPLGLAVQRQVVKYGFTLQLAVATPAAVVPTCSQPGSDQVGVCWDESNNARGNNVTVTANYTFTTFLPLPLPGIPMTGRSTLVINH